jgi:uncharacterized membrane protein YhaH (DUF805 family)
VPEPPNAVTRSEAKAALVALIALAFGLALAAVTRRPLSDVAQSKLILILFLLFGLALAWLQQKGARRLVMLMAVLIWAAVLIGGLGSLLGYF